MGSKPHIVPVVAILGALGCTVIYGFLALFASAIMPEYEGSATYVLLGVGELLAVLAGIAFAKVDDNGKRVADDCGYGFLIAAAIAAFVSRVLYL